MFYGKQKTRAIFKKKNEQFAEINPKVERTLYETRRDIKAVEKSVPRYVNVNRMISLESKIGKIDVNDEEKLARAVKQFCDDVWVDFVENDGELWGELSEENQTQAKHDLLDQVRSFFIEQKQLENTQ
jgi:hypothetical protein